MPTLLYVGVHPQSDELESEYGLTMIRGQIDTML